MKNVLISGYIGFNNFGDEAIFKALSNHLKNIGINASVLCKKDCGYSIDTYNYKNILDIIKAIKNCDILISGGGSLLQNKTSNFSLIYYLCIIFLAKIFSKKTIIFAQGIEAINGKFYEFLTKTILKTTDFITVRDKKSKELLESWKIKSTLVSDPAYSLVQDMKINENKEGLLIQLRDFKNLDKNFIKSLSLAIKNNYKGKISLIAFQDSDIDICEEFLKEFDDITFYKNKTVDETIEIINNSKYIISTRLHGLIIASALNTKPFALIYDDKIKTISDELNIQNINLYCYNDNEFENKLSYFFKNENTIKNFRRFDWEIIDRNLEVNFE